MPEAWRITRAEYAAEAFTGEGAAKTGGRWNSRGVAVVYTSATRALAALETLVHLNPPMTFKYRIIRIEFAGELVRHVHSKLPSDWRDQPAPDSTRRLGDVWARERRSAILAVPSIIIPDETNYVINPAHPDFKKIHIAKPVDFAFDARLAG
jgi:RES domain-containing protein